MVEPNPGKVVVAVGEVGHDAALRWGTAYALRHGCALRVVHVLRPVWPAARDVSDVSVVHGELLKAGRGVVDRAAEQVITLAGNRIPVSAEVLHGRVASSLVEECADASVVVLQRHRTNYRHHIPTMSVTNGVASRASVPVVAVPGDWEEPLPDQPTTKDARRRLVVGVEGAPETGAVAEAALDQAIALSGSGVRLVRAWPRPWFPEEEAEVASPEETLARRTDVLGADFHELLERFPQVVHELVAVPGRPADVLVEESHRARLVVLGRHHPSVPFGSHLGPVTRAVLLHAGCPVMVVAPGPWSRSATKPQVEAAVTGSSI